MSELSKISELLRNHQRGFEDQVDEIKPVIEGAVEFLSLSLSGFYRTRDNDSLIIQRVRTRGFEDDSRALSEVIDLCRKLDGHQLQLIIGSEPITLHRFGRGAYSSTAYSTITAQPEKVIPLTGFAPHSSDYSSEEAWPLEMRPKTEMFVGNPSGYVPLTSIARTLNEGGLLVIVGPDRAKED